MFTKAELKVIARGLQHATDADTLYLNLCILPHTNRRSKEVKTVRAKLENRIKQYQRIIKKISRLTTTP